MGPIKGSSLSRCEPFDRTAVFYRIRRTARRSVPATFSGPSAGEGTAPGSNRIAFVVAVACIRLKPVPIGPKCPPFFQPIHNCAVTANTTAVIHQRGRTAPLWNRLLRLPFRRGSDNFVCQRQLFERLLNGVALRTCFGSEESDHGAHSGIRVERPLAESLQTAFGGQPQTGARRRSPSTEVFREVFFA